jgi:hypothetical protein
MTRAKAAIPDGWLQNVVTAKISIGKLRYPARSL